MADMNALVHIKDENGNVNNIFPATKIENVEGLQSALNAKANTSDVTSGLAGKVDKETGKGLSTNDYTTAEKNKLSGIEAQANKTIISKSIPASPTDDTVPSMKLVADTYAPNSDLVAVQDKVNNNKIYNVLDYGVEADTNTDQLAAINALTEIINTDGGGVIYFPRGKYNVSDTIFLPANTILRGDGFSTYIYLTSDQSHYGTAIGNGGSNVSVENIRVGFVGDTDTPVTGSQLGGIGFSNYLYEYAKEGDFTHQADAENLSMRNIYATGRFPCQSEPSSNYKLKNIIYDGIFAPKGAVTVSPSGSNFYNVENCVCTNIICSLFRIGYSAFSSNNVIISNIKCNYLRLLESNIVASNIVVDNTDTSDPHYQANLYEMAVMLNGSNIVINNIKVIGSKNNNTKYGIYLESGNVTMSNAYVSGFKNFNYYTRQATGISNLSNSDFTDANGTTSIIKGLGDNVKVTNETGAAFYSDLVPFITPITFVTGATALFSSIANRVIITKQRFAFHIACSFSAGFISSNKTIATLNSRAFPLNDLYFYGYAYNDDYTVAKPIVLTFDTEGNVKTATIYFNIDYSNCTRIICKSNWINSLDGHSYSS